MPQFNQDVIAHELVQRLFCDIWIIDLYFYLILRRKTKGIKQGV